MQIFSHPAPGGMVSSREISMNFMMPLAASPVEGGFFYALALSTVLALGNYLALRWARTRSLQQFLWVLVGGFLGRLVIFGLAVVSAWKLSRFDAKTFTWTLLISYLLFQFIETIVLQRHFKRAKSLPKA